MSPAENPSSDSESITFEIDLEHSPSKVWRALTDPVLLAEWLLPITGLKLETGATFTLQAQPQPGWDGVVNCKLVDIDPHKQLSWAWVVGELNTAVTFTLNATDSGTHLIIVQSGFRPDQKQNSAGARYGWKHMSAKLVVVLAKLS